MANINKVIIAGKLTRDPELRYTPKGTAVTKIGMAINRTWKNESGEKQQEVTFVDIDAFGRQAELAAQYLKKGSNALIEGRLKYNTWEDKNTKAKQSKITVLLDSIHFLDQKSAASPAADSEPTSNSAGAPAADDDVPF